MPGPSDQTYLIVGAGVFGASTALHLKRCFPSARVQLLDRTPFPNPSAASEDTAKIVRADYDTMLYMPIALEALKVWNNDPIYKPYFHESGMAFVEPDESIAFKTYDNYQKIKPEANAVIMKPNEFKSRFPLHRDANFDGVEYFLWSPYSGWAEGGVLASAIQAAIDIGVEYIVACISSLTFDSSGACTGAECADGRTFAAHSTILCTGAYTAKILADSAPHREELQAGDRISCAGATCVMINIPEEQRSRYENLPIIIHAMPRTAIDLIPAADNKIKFNCQISFTNMVHHEKLGRDISVPPKPLTQSTWTHDVPVGLKKEVLRGVRDTLGPEAEGFEVDSYRICWEGITPSQDWIISPHSGCKDLYLATGGSFHAFKFFPILGPYVVQMLQGQLNPELAKTWAWDRQTGGSACAAYVPDRDLRDVEGWRSWMEGEGGDEREWKRVRYDLL